MLNQIFNPDNAVFRALAKAVDLVVLSALWLLCSLPIVTLGASTAALYYTVVKCVRRGKEGTYRSFFSSFRENFRPALPLSLLTALLWFLLDWGYRIILTLANTQGGVLVGAYMAYLIALVLPIGVLCWLFPLLSRFAMGPWGLLAAAFRLAVGHLPTTVLLALLFTVTVNFCRVYWFYLLPLLLAPSLLALINSLFLEKFLRPSPRHPPRRRGKTRKNLGITGEWYFHREIMDIKMK